MKLQKIQAFLFTIVALFTISCGDEKTLTDTLNEDQQATSGKEKIEISEEVFKDIIQGIPSPLEISALIKESGAEFNTAILNDADNTKNYTTNYKRALNLGILGADLGYINIYNKTSTSLGYLASLKGLADDLRVGQFFDFSTIRRLAMNSGDIDSLLNITTAGFEDMNNYLVEQGRGDIGVLLLVGGWIEALHIAAEIAKTSQDPKLLERVGEQKITLDELQLLLQVYQDDINIGKLTDDFQTLKAEFDKVEISYEYAEPEMKEVNGILVVVDNSRSIVNMTPEQFQNIIMIVENIRNKMIN